MASEDLEVVTGEIVASRHLTPQQLQAASLDAVGLQRPDIAKVVGVNTSTIRDWRKLDEYKEEVSRLRRESAEGFNEPIRKLQLDLIEAGQKGVATLLAALDAVDSRARPNWPVRTRAAELLVKYGVDVSSQVNAGADGPRAPSSGAVTITFNPEGA